jgi:hypothetical protein
LKDQTQTIKQPKPQSDIKQDTTIGMGDENKACRICHESNNPLFCPCKCSGSIKYVHAECLKRWLRVNRRKKCEVCGEELSFKKEFAENAPRSKFSLPVLRELIVEWVPVLAHRGLYVLAAAGALWFVPALSFLLYRLSFLLTCGCGWQRDFSEHHWPLYICINGFLEMFCVVGFVWLLDCIFLRQALLVSACTFCCMILFRV